MNRIVREHYPVEKLPEDLRAELVGQSTVTVTIESDEQSTATASRSSIMGVLAEAKRLREAGVIKPTTTEEAVTRVRALRDEWEDR